MKSSKGQISMFIIISVIIISAMVFLVFMSNDSKKEEISRGTDVDTQERVLFIKQYVDSCMEKQLEKALIVSGLKGGFIYGVPDGIYRWSFIDPDPYPYHFIGNVDLDWNSLGWNLVHARELRIGITVPSLPENVDRSIYNESVKSHFERYLFEEFGKNCQHNMESIEKLGFDFVNKDFSGKLGGLPILDSSQVIVKDLDGEVGDRVMFKLDSKTYTGVINDIQGFKNFNVVLDSGQRITPFNQQMNLVSVYNLNSTATVNVSFNKDETEMKFLYPILLNDSSRDSVVFVESVVSVPVRFRALRFLSEGLMNEKMDNRSINLSNSIQLNNILRDINKRSAFLDDLSELTFKIHKINDSPEYKEYVYYFFDNGSKILGNPYVYRFGYRNHAPSFNLSVLCVNDNIEDECILAYVADNRSWRNSTINISARMDPEVMDCRPKGYYSSADPGDCGDVRYVDLDPSDIFTLSTQGNYTFKAELDGKYPFDIQLTDGEAYTIQKVFFVVGTPANFNNNDVTDCIKFNNSDKPGFPIDALFKGPNSESEIFTNVSNGRTKAYAYALYPGSYSIKVLDSCFGDPGNNYIEYWIRGVHKGEVTRGNQGFLFNVNTSDISQEIKIQINDPQGNAINKENYTLTVYPSKCLGPRALPGGKLGEEDWLMTCCNMEILNRSIYDENVRGDLARNEDPNRYFRDGSQPNNDFALNDDVYFCYDPFFNSQSTSGHLGYDRYFHSQNIFDYSYVPVTSLLKAHTRIICDGTSAVGNLTSIGGGTRRGPSGEFPTGHLVSGFGKNAEIRSLANPQIYANFAVVGGGFCNFCHIPIKSNFVIKLAGGSRYFPGKIGVDDYDSPTQGLILTTGLVHHNNDLLFGTLGDLSQRYDNRYPSSSPRFDQTRVHCTSYENQKFGCADGRRSCYKDGEPILGRWLFNSAGKGINLQEIVSMGQKYCRLDGECYVRSDLSSISTTEDEVVEETNETGHVIKRECKDHWFEPEPKGGGRFKKEEFFSDCLNLEETT